MVRTWMFVQWLNYRGQWKAGVWDECPFSKEENAFGIPPLKIYEKAMGGRHRSNCENGLVR
jgi:hypothetical protein